MTQHEVYFTADSRHDAFFIDEFCASLGLDSAQANEPTTVKLASDATCRVFGKEVMVTAELRGQPVWPCRLAHRAGFDFFAVGELTWAARACDDITDLSPLKRFIGLTFLDLEKCVSLLEIRSLAAFKELIFLHLSCRNLRCLRPLAGLISLRTLEIACEEVADLQPLSNLTALRRLDIHHSRVENLESLRGLTELVSLSILGYSLREIDALWHLKNLSELSLGGSPFIQDVKPLGGLSSLKTLGLSLPNIKCLPPLAGLKHLTDIDLLGCESLRDITGLSGLTNLRSLILCECKAVKSITPLRSLTGLKELNLAGIPLLKSSKALTVHTQLQDLVLGGCTALKCLKGLSTLNNLQTLDLNCCELLTDLSPLAGLGALQRLNLEGCHALTELGMLAGMTSLKHLNLAECTSITDLSGLALLTGLQSLILNDCVRLRDLGGLSGLSGLRSLSFYRGPKVDLRPLAGLAELNELYLYECDWLTDLSPLAALRGLKELEITSRRVTSIEPLRGLVHLRELREYHPDAVADILADAAYRRRDLDYIRERGEAWLETARGGDVEGNSYADQLAISLGQAFSLLGADPLGEAFDELLRTRPGYSAGPWQAWLGGVATHSGFEAYRSRVEALAVAELPSGAIGGICATLPIARHTTWSRTWLTTMTAARLGTAKSLLGVAAPLVLAHERLGESAAQEQWLAALTDPSDPGALDTVQVALAEYQLTLPNWVAAENHLATVVTASQRDSLLEKMALARAETDPEVASYYLLLINEPSRRAELALLLAALSAGTTRMIERLVVAMGDSPEKLAQLLERLPPDAGVPLREALSQALQWDRAAACRRLVAAHQDAIAHYLAGQNP